MRPQKGIVSALLGIGILAVSLALGSPGSAPAAASGKDASARASALPPRNVRVVNVKTEAVPVDVVKAPARQPWQAALTLDLADGETSKFVAIPDPPPGKRIVIEFGSAQLLVLRTQVPYIQLYLSMTGNDPAVGHGFALTNVGAYSEGQYVWQSSHLLKLTSAQGSVRVLRAGGSNGPFFATLSLSGFEEDNE